MERLTILARLSLVVLLSLQLLLLQHGAEGRMLATGGDLVDRRPPQIQGQLPPCNFPGNIPGWDCFDPPKENLPPCDFKHQRAGFDCWPKNPPSAATVGQEIAGQASTKSARIQGQLPPCNFPGNMPGWDCFDPPKENLPPCDFKHQRAGFDCWPRNPPSAATVSHEIIEATAGGASTKSTRIQGQLPPCNFPDNIPGWECFDPPKENLPSCDFKHQRAGFDCWPKNPPSATQLP